MSTITTILGTDNITDSRAVINTNFSNLNTDKVEGNGAITGATKTKITYDAKGLVTAGTDATTADIADSLNKRYVTDANLTTIGNQSGTNTGDQSLFSTIAVSGQSNVVADTTSDTLTLVAGTNVTITTNATTDTITINSTGGGGGALDDLTDVTITTPANGQALIYNGSVWVNSTPAGGGDVVGPASAVDSNIAAFNTTTGKLIKDGGATIAQVRDRSTHTGTQTASTISDINTYTGTLTNKTLIDATTTIADDIDNTKKIAFQASGITTATTRTATMPNKDITLAGITNETFTNATITGDGATNTLTLDNSGSGTTLKINNGGSGPFITVDTNKMVLDNAGNLSVAGGLSTLSTIELGHATDTTISRVSPGVVAIEGVNIVTTVGATFTGDIVVPAEAYGAGWNGSNEAPTKNDLYDEMELHVGGNAAKNIGYLNIPQNSQSAAYTLVLTDAGKHIYHPSADTTARTFTIPANASVAYPIGTAITFVNDTSAGVITIAITTDTLVLAGAGTTGSRTLAANGVATAIKVTSTRWIISGTGLT